MEQLNSCIKIEHSTNIKTKEFRYVWKITNLQYFPNHFIRSEVFSTDGLLWDLRIYRDKCNKDDETCFNVVIKLLSPRSEFHQSCFTELSAINEKGESVNKKKKLVTEEHLKSNFGTVDFYSFLSKDLLNENVMPTNQLTLQCKIFLYQNYYTEKKEDTNDDEIPLNQRLIEFDDFEKLFENEYFSDLKVIVGEKKFNVHKGILTARSPVFAAMFEHEMKERKENEVNIVDVDAEVMKEVLRFIYAGKVNGIKELASDLLPVAEKYQLKRLIAECEEVLISGLNSETVVNALVLVDKCYCAKKLKMATINFAIKNMKILEDSDNFKTVFKTLSAELLREFICTQSTMLNVES